jgi:hypothetical protein
MGNKKLRRATVLAVVCLLIGATAVFADTIPADGDSVTAGNQNFVYLGAHAPGALVTTNVSFALTCAGLNHAVPGQTITVSPSSVTVPLDGTATATATTIGPVPDTWTAAGAGCPFPAPTLPANDPSTVTLRMPTTPGDGYIFTVMYARTGGSGLTGVTAISFEVDVIANTPPVLSLPGSIGAEASSPSGATVTFAATATDAEDDPDPTPTCTPASGDVFGLGTTTVDCSVTDGGGLSASGSFTVTVSDTTAPVLVLPGDLTAEASGPAGASVGFSVSASDVVDGDVAVACDHASGDTFPLGTTVVACSSADAAGNATSGSFNVTVGDSTAPVLSGVPADISVTTNDPTGTTVSYTAPTASDAADPNPTVGCAPASGSFIAVGTTTVTCTATDATGNSSTAGFHVTVQFIPDDPDVDWTVDWGSPVSGSPASLETNRSRNVPIKVRIFADGVEQTDGSATLRVDACGGETALVVPLTWGSGRWDGRLDASLLVAGCYIATATLDGVDAGSFALEVRGGDNVKAPANGPSDVTSSPAPSETTAKDKPKGKAPKK